MSQFYTNAKGLLSQSTFGQRGAPNSSSTFLGASPNIGVAVLKRSQTIKKAEGHGRAAATGLDPVHEGMGDSFDEEDVKPVELYYSTSGDNSDDLHQISIEDLADHDTAAQEE